MFSKDYLHRVQDGKFQPRQLSKETSAANPSFRVYYGVAPGAVPFLWESRPGTPKHASSDTPLPPLTPPPAYFSSPARSRCSKKPSKSSLIIDTILPKLSLRKSASASSSESTASSLASSPAASSGSTRRGRPTSPMSSYSSRGEDEESDDVSSPTSTLCFRGRRSRGRHSVVPMKSALLSMVHGHHGS